MSKLLLLLLALGGSLQAGCIAIQGDQILGKDLALADRAFAPLNPGLYFSYAPAVGKQRTISPSELAGWAAAHGISYTPHGPVCFERTAYTLTPDDAAAKIRQAFGERQVQVDVLEVCKCNLPSGTLEFPLKGAALPPLGHPDTPVLWRGQLISKDGIAHPVWARVRVLADMVLVKARENIRAQEVISPGQVEEVRAAESPLRFPEPQSAATYIGKLTTRSILEGSYLDPKSARVPPDVVPGTIVKVEVTDGPTRLQLDARAETGGSMGDRITLTNPSGLRRFQATVSGPGHAQIILAPNPADQTTAENKGAPAATTSRRIL